MVTLSWGVLVGTLVVLVVCCTALLLATVGVRLGRARRARRHAERTAHVRPLVLEVLTAEGEEIPPACEAVAALPDRLWPAAETFVLAAFDSVRGEVRDALVQVLLARGTLERALAATQSRSAVRRARAAEVIGLVGHVSGRRGLVRLLSDPDLEVRTVAARALGQIGDPHLTTILLDSLRPGSDVPPSVVGTALLGSGETDTAALVAGLDADDEVVRLATARAVADRGLTDPSVTVRVQAARALARLGGAWAVPDLAAATDPSEASVVRVAATRTLSDMPFPPARSHLVRLRDDEDPDVRRLAVAATPPREVTGGGDA
jgi:hypothetical protein